MGSFGVWCWIYDVGIVEKYVEFGFLGKEIIGRSFNGSEVGEV